MSDPSPYSGIVTPPNLYEDVLEFRKKFDIAYGGKPRVLPLDLYTMQKKHLYEEIREWRSDILAAHSVVNDRAEMTHLLAQSLDALVDLVYVAIGTAILSGFNFNEAWRRVHAANMQKQRIHTEHKQGIIKPVDWEPPKLDDLVEDHGTHS